MEFIKKNLTALLAGFLGVFHFILLAIPFLVAKAEAMGRVEKEGASGYVTIGNEMEGGGFYSLAMIVTLICAVVLILVAAYLFVKAYAVKTLPDQFGSITVEQIGKYALIGYAALNLLVLLAAIIVSSQNSYSEVVWGMVFSAKVNIGFGVFLGVILSAAGVAAPIVLEKMGILSAEGKETPVCPGCGAPVKKNDAFCVKCGTRLEP